MSLGLDSTSPPVSGTQLPRHIRAVTGVAILSAIGMFFGYARDAGLAAVFGASRTTDAFFVATLIPTMVATVVMSSALSPAVLPVFAGLLDRRDKAWAVANSILTLSILALTGLSIVLLIGTTQLVQWLAPGFEPDRLTLSVRLVMITAPAVAFLGLSALLGSLINALGVYNVPALGPLLVNGTTFAAIILAGPRWRIEGVGFGLVVGGVLHLAVQLVTLRRLGWVYWPSLDLNQPGVQEVFRLFWPLLAFVALAQSVPIIERMIASEFAAGQLSQLTYANKLSQIPMFVLSSSVAVVVFPVLSRDSAAGHVRSYVTTLGSGIRNVVLLTTPAALWLFLAALPWVTLVFQRGEFATADARATADLLRIYSLAVVPHGFLLVLFRAFHALRDTVTPLVIGVLNTAVYVVSALLLSHRLELAGLPLAFLASQVFGSLLSFAVLCVRLKSPIDALLGNGFVRVCLAGLMFALLLTGWLHTAQPLLARFTTPLQALFLATSVILSGFVYLGIAKAAGVPEARLYLTTLLGSDLSLNGARLPCDDHPRGG